MTVRPFRGSVPAVFVVCTGLVSVLLGACHSNPAQPSAVVGLPSVISPADNSQVAFASQPLMLVVSNATIGGAVTATYTFEVATDSAFADKVQTKSVSQGSSGQTTAQLDQLPTSKDYYWHVRAEAGGTNGVFTNATKFTVVPLGAPTPVSPANGAVVSGWPTLVVNNVQKSGTTGALVYRFDISTSSSFGSIATSGTVAEGLGQTSFTPSGATPTGQATLFWRASAIDQGGGVTGPASTIQSFVLSSSQASQIASQEGISLWPAAQPPNAPGHAQLGDSWNIQTVTSFHGVVHQTPTVDELRVFDLLDRGFDPQSAIDWINNNGYFTNAAYYPGPQVIGFDFEYMAFIGGRWDLVFKGE